MTMRDYAREQTAALLVRLEAEVDRTARSAGAKEVHDLRVTIRRFSECLRQFDRFFPARPIRRRLKGIMGAAGSVRDRDIALELLAASGARAPGAAEALVRERRLAGDRLQQRLKAWKRGALNQECRAALGL